MTDNQSLESVSSPSVVADTMGIDARAFIIWAVTSPEADPLPWSNERCDRALEKCLIRELVEIIHDTDDPSVRVTGFGFQVARVLRDREEPRWNDPPGRRVYLTGPELRWLLLTLKEGDDVDLDDDGYILGRLYRKLGGDDAHAALRPKYASGEP